MPGMPDTQRSLLLRLRDPADHAAWHQFNELYHAAVYRLARLRGLQPADAEDVTQRVFVSVSQAIGRWDPDPERGRFRNWLLRIARNATLNALTRRRPDLGLGGTSNIDLLRHVAEPGEGWETDWELEFRRQVFRWAMREVRNTVSEANWNAFWMTTMEGESIEAAAERWNKSPGAIYAARCRIMKMLRDRVREFESDEDET